MENTIRDLILEQRQAKTFGEEHKAKMDIDRLQEEQWRNQLKNSFKKKN
jgi:hypothetical protein